MRKINIHTIDHTMIDIQLLFEMPIDCTLEDLYFDGVRATVRYRDKSGMLTTTRQEPMDFRLVPCKK